VKSSFYFCTDALDLADATKRRGNLDMTQDKKVPMTLTDEEIVTSSKLTRRTLLAGAGIALGTVALAGGMAKAAEQDSVDAEDKDKDDAEDKDKADAEDKDKDDAEDKDKADVEDKDKADAERDAD
jgi:hypothetical protein